MARDWDLLDAIAAVLPEEKTSESASQQVSESAKKRARRSSDEEDETTRRARSCTHAWEFEQHETSVAIIGRPNVGKSTLLNALTGTSRAIVSPIAGTTRDAVDEVVEFEGTQFRFVDTAAFGAKARRT